MMSKWLLTVSLLLAAHGAAQAVVAPIASPTSLDFSYQANNTTLPSSKTIQVTVPAALASSLLTATVTPAGSWLTVTPDTGRAPLTLTVNVNPTSLAPGSYAGSVIITATTVGVPSAITVPVVLSIVNPPAVLSVTQTPPSTAANGQPALSFSYVTGDATPTPASALLNISSTGDTIPFTVTAGGSGTGSTTWLRVGVQGQAAAVKTSGVALSGSSVPLVVSIDSVVLATLDPGSYSASVAIAGTNTANGSTTVPVTLVVSAGRPTVQTMFPNSVVQGTAVNGVLTIGGDNFFNTSVVMMTVNQTPGVLLPSGVPTDPQKLTTTLLSRKVLTAIVPAALLKWQLAWTIQVRNPAPPNDPSQPAAGAPSFFSVVSPTTPVITSILNAASYTNTASFTGSGNNPVGAAATSLAPREIISIFGQNLGPASPVVATPVGNSPAVFLPGPTGNMQVQFTAGGKTMQAPLLMVSSNQINAIVPVGVAGAATADVVVINSSTSETTAPLTVTVVPADPGIFTFGGLGKGQAAVLNVDSTTGAVVVNSTKDTAPRGGAIEIFATGLGDYDKTAAGVALGDGEVPTTAIAMAPPSTVRVDIDGQPAVVMYAGTSAGAVAGLVQINAIVPPTVRALQAIPITVSWGDATVSRRSQALATIGVK